MALKTIRHWGWGLLRSVLVGTGDGAVVAVGVAAANGVGIDIPTLTVKQFGMVLIWSAGRAFFKYLKDTPLPDLEETIT